MSDKKIILTPEELADIKDEARFRERVLIQLKGLNGIPKEVWQLKVQSIIHWAFILGIVFLLLKNGN